VETRTPLTPTQERLLAQLRRDPEPLLFDQDFVADLRSRAQAGFEHLSARLGGEKLHVSKGLLNRVLGCEVQHLLPDDFEWTPAKARGFVAHKAIELRSNWRGDPSPGQLVDEAIERLSDQQNGRGDYVAGLSDADHAELRGGAIERVTRIMQDFPPIPNSAHPVFEAPTKWPATTCIEVSSKVDLVLGKPDGRVSTRLIVDFKTGQKAHHHRLDLRFYALLETIVRAVPPRKLVTYYLDYAEADIEVVTEATLESALDRVLSAVEREVELREGREPIKRPGTACRWCALKGSCHEGRAFLELDDLTLTQGFDDAPSEVRAFDALVGSQRTHFAADAAVSGT
jgi:CRISPR/Cas system-associated exonuclease Cas4 (RecB family)